MNYVIGSVSTYSMVRNSYNGDLVLVDGYLEL